MTSASRQQLFLELLEEGGNTGLWTYTPAAASVWANPAACRLMGRDTGAGTGLDMGLDDWLLALPTAERPDLQAALEQASASQTGFARTVRLQAVGDDNAQLSLRGRWRPCAGATPGELVCVVERAATGLSPAERQRLECDSKRLERFASALRASPVSLFEQDTDLRYRWTFSPRLGSKAPALVGQRAAKTMAPESASTLDQAKRAVIQSGQAARAHFHLSYLDGTHFSVDAYMAPTHGPDGAVSGVVSVSLDMAEMAQREVQLLAAFEQAPICIVLSRFPDGTIVNVNAHFEQLFGYTREEAIGSSPLALQLWHPISSGKRFVELLQTDGHVRNRITEYRHKDGHVGRLLISAEKVDVEGATLLLGMLMDISELEDTRNRLAFSEARYQLLAEGSSEGVALSKDGVLVETNAQMARILGVSNAQAIGTLVDSGLLPAAPTGPSVAQHCYVRPDGSVLNLEISSRALVQGTQVLQMATLRDITQTMEKERSLQHLRASIDHLMDSNMVGMMVVEVDGAILDANAYILNLLGRSPAELEAGALNWIDMTPVEYMSNSERLRMHEQVLRTGHCPAFERPLLKADGTVVHMLMAVTLQPDSVHRALIIALDITEQRSAQAELLRVNAQLQKRTAQAERAEAAKTLFLSSVSHELRTPLHTILGYVRLLRKAAKAPKEQEELAIVERRGAHLLRLIDDLLEFNHTLLAPENLSMEFIAMEGFVGSLEAMFSAMAENSGHGFELRRVGLLPAGIVQDEGRLVQVLRILVDNACKYSTEGRITLTLDCTRAPEAAGLCRLQFAVQDSGRGIADADKAHIFEPLRRGSNADDQPGLGLAIAAQWIQRMGSSIAVQSQLGAGSCFGFALPVQARFEGVPRWPEPGSAQTALAQVAGPAGPSALPPLPTAELAMLGQLIGMGRMGRIASWARELATRQPELQAFADQIANLAANAKVDALERLYQRWVA
jgi:PAS domain S-box-containing protein